MVLIIDAVESMEEDRQSNYERGITDEANMGFGQIVALCLLIQPILQLFDSITGMFTFLFSFSWHVHNLSVVSHPP